ncbi:hypothetical protein B4135_2519 [Caldibacillus debilis]|uniref:Uncharacterized protein n=1 Tax=Caldibacillus debilis TaxID=301148 RepID=A0A150LYW4_9BACI|nr:hypothetical protein B4135_2519 [Caldibacillus debilis]
MEGKIRGSGEEKGLKGNRTFVTLHSAGFSGQASGCAKTGEFLFRLMPENHEAGG